MSTVDRWLQRPDLQLPTSVGFHVCVGTRSHVTESAASEFHYSFSVVRVLLTALDTDWNHGTAESAKAN